VIQYTPQYCTVYHFSHLSLVCTTYTVELVTGHGGFTLRPHSTVHRLSTSHKKSQSSPWIYSGCHVHTEVHFAASRESNPYGSLHLLHTFVTMDPSNISRFSQRPSRPLTSGSAHQRLGWYHPLHALSFLSVPSLDAQVPRCVLWQQLCLPVLQWRVARHP